MVRRILKRLQHKKLSTLASLCFFFGSMLFLPSFAEFATVGVWLFMTGSALMFCDILYQ